MLDKFNKYIDEYVLYSTVKEPAINNACTMASLHNSIAVDESIEDIINSHGINNLIEDCRNIDKYWAFNTLWNSGLNHSTVIELPSDKFMPLRDYAILSKSLIFYEEDGVHYVTFIVSDGDNMQWLLGSNFTMKNWSNNKPIISCRDLLWSGLEDEDQLITNIYTKINSGYTNIKDPNSYTFVYVHVWSNTMDNVNNVVNKLNKNSKVRIVSPDTFIKLIINNVPHVDT